jgi:uncharacterized membrane protein YdjX (TVP38/TMEM64 family)
VQGELHHLISAAGVAGPLLFIAAEAALTLLFLPRSAGALVAGALFGTAFGTVLTWLAMMIGATIAYWVGHAGRGAGGRAAHLASDRRRAQIAAWVARLDRWMERRGPLAILYSRLIPGMPFTSINYAAGMTAIPARAFVLATAVGILPYTYLLVALGDSVARPTSARFIATATVIVLLAAVAPVIERVVRR